MEAMTQRYKAIKDSQTAHCCFEATVVDTNKPRSLYPGDEKFTDICECFDMEDAERIAAALNKMEGEKQRVNIIGTATSRMTLGWN